MSARTLFACLALAVCTAAAPVRDPLAGYDFPALTGRVVDAADLLPSAQEDKLTRRLAAVERTSKHQFVVVTVKSLSGHDIADYGLKLGNHWRIGRAKINDGVLLIVAPNERKVRIEVGFGLEKALRDDEADAIIQNAILPHFRAKRMADGIMAGSEAIIREITT